MPSNRFDPAVPLNTLVIHDRNPRRGDLAAIARSIDTNGFYGALVAQESTRKILAGNHRYLSALDRGLTALPVFFCRLLRRNGDAHPSRR